MLYQQVKKDRNEVVRNFKNQKEDNLRIRYVITNYLLSYTYHILLLLQEKFKSISVADSVSSKSKLDNSNNKVCN